MVKNLFASSLEAKTPYDVIVVGGGLAGLVTALSLKPARVLLVTGAALGEMTASAWAQGGIAAAIGEDDDPKLHAYDTIQVAGGLADSQRVAILTEEGPDRLHDLIQWGAAFDRDSSGNLALGREAAHSRRRIVHAKGDSTGAEVIRALVAAVKSSDHIDHLIGWTQSLLGHEGSVEGVVVQTHLQTLMVAAQHVVLATGGCGQLFERTTNPAQSFGAGLILAGMAGAELVDLEFMQFHPTAIDVGQNPMPLATEALRGEGAWLIDSRNQRFMTQVHDLAELAPRDVVARAIYRRVASGQKVYLDATRAVGDQFPQRFPTVYQICRNFGLDPRKDPIPVAPAAHYHMGGIGVDEWGQTSLAGLYAVGEVASTLIHGANRLASNSLLEAMVFGTRAAQHILGKTKSKPKKLSKSVTTKGEDSNPEVSRKMAQILYRGCGLIRDEAGLQQAAQSLIALKSQVGSGLARGRLELSYAIVAAALTRRESRGGHFRSDYPEASERPARHSRVTFAQLPELSQAAPSRPRQRVGGV